MKIRHNIFFLPSSFRPFFLLPLLLFPLLFSNCEGDTAARKAARGEDFVPDPNHIFFKNTRARHYQATEMEKANFTVYRHEDLLASPATLLPAILDRWIEDRASLLLETRLQADEPPTNRPFRLDVQTGQNWETIPLNTPPSREEILLLNGHLLAERELRIVSGLDTLVAIPGEARAAVRTVIDDYLRLTD